MNGFTKVRFVCQKLQTMSTIEVFKRHLIFNHPLITWKKYGQSDCVGNLLLKFETIYMSVVVLLCLEVGVK